MKAIIQSIKLFFRKKEEFYGLSLSELGFIPRNKGIYKLALLHKSASVVRNGVTMNYERLEFLGDAVLGAIIAHLLYKFFPNKDEGFLTKIRSNLVSRESLNALAVNMGLDKSVVAKSDLMGNKHVYGDVFEAFVGAIFLDQGFAVTQKFIENFVFPNYFDIREVVEKDTNYKSRLIEWGQKNKVELEMNTEDLKSGRRSGFFCRVFVNGEEKGQGQGRSKKEAEQRAAEKTMHLIRETRNLKLMDD